MCVRKTDRFAGRAGSCAVRLGRAARDDKAEGAASAGLYLSVTTVLEAKGSADGLLAATEKSFMVSFCKSHELAKRSTPNGEWLQTL